ncbi:hypothetical protein QYF61_010612 [Mycteria americana]|uniref:Uncharacterized protein n=1 Tax=Mycteria americana TaxID=33587 RepID=A0AAN7NQV7_MYCAM|nr:hypothetical protein QYF61_010612 [Mycteria americana]
MTLARLASFPSIPAEVMEQHILKTTSILSCEGHEVQIHLSHFNSSSLIHLLIVSMFFSGMTLGYLSIYTTGKFSDLLKPREFCNSAEPGFHTSGEDAEETGTSTVVQEMMQVGEVFHPSDHFHGPPLDLLQQVHVFPALRTPGLDTVLQVGSHQSRAEGENHLPRPAGHASFGAAQDMVDFLGRECTLLAHVQLFTHQYPQVLLCRAALNLFIPQPVLTPGVAATQVQDLALGLVEPHEIHKGSLLELVQVPLDGIPTLTHVNRTTQLGVVCKFVDGGLDPTVYVTDEDIKQYWSQYTLLRDTTCH